MISQVARWDADLEDEARDVSAGREVSRLRSQVGSIHLLRSPCYDSGFDHADQTIPLLTVVKSSAIVSALGRPQAKTLHIDLYSCLLAGADIRDRSRGTYATGRFMPAAAPNMKVTRFSQADVPTRSVSHGSKHEVAAIGRQLRLGEASESDHAARQGAVIMLSPFTPRMFIGIWSTESPESIPDRLVMS